MTERRLQHGQNGAALLIFLILIVAAALTYWVDNLTPGAIESRRQQKTDAALTAAKEALIGYAVSRDLSSGSARPGDLPCPDTTNSGNRGASCGNQLGTTGQAARLGRLPWRSLGLPELKDGAGETLWYAVSSNFKENTRINRLNSDTMRLQSASPFIPAAGSITIRDARGNILFDGSNGSGVAAVIMAPGPPLQRQDGTWQDRGGANINNPLHYLDNVQPTADVPVIAAEDNANFGDNTPNGFFFGPIRNNQGTLVANDRMIVITFADIAAAMENRVVGEASRCLSDYAAQPENKQHLPWAADMSNSASGNYGDVSGTLFGRLPNDFSNTTADSGATMLFNWTGVCMFNGSNSWFNDNWREIVLYALADSFKPATPLNPAACGACLTIKTTGAPLTNRSFVVLVAGRVLSGQSRSTVAEKSTVAQYLELENSSPLDGIFETKAPSAGIFNDRIRFFPSP